MLINSSTSHSHAQDASQPWNERFTKNVNQPVLFFAHMQIAFPFFSLQKQEIRHQFITINTIIQGKVRRSRLKWKVRDEIILSFLLKTVQFCLYRYLRSNLLHLRIFQFLASSKSHL